MVEHKSLKGLADGLLRYAGGLDFSAIHQKFPLLRLWS
jgi:hypothetical protein